MNVMDKELLPQRTIATNDNQFVLNMRQSQNLTPGEEILLRGMLEDYREDLYVENTQLHNEQFRRDMRANEQQQAKAEEVKRQYIEEPTPTVAPI
jgi:hypothetical protein